jgi:hypothetical protein
MCEYVGRHVGTYVYVYLCMYLQLRQIDCLLPTCFHEYIK